jgi:hypothetical protein
MRSNSAGRLLVLCGAVTLVACQDDVTGPPERGAQGQVASLSGRCGEQQSRAGVADGSLGAQRANIPGLGLVTITATYSGSNFGFGGLATAMNFPRYYGSDLAPCMNDAFASYNVDVPVAAELDPIPAPEGVDGEWWGQLSPREQLTILRYAEQINNLRGGEPNQVGGIINVFFGEAIRQSKFLSKLAGNDFFSGRPIEGEQFAGGCYACLLYRKFVTNPQWPFSNEVTLKLVVELVSSWSEAQFTTTPLRGLQFARNGAFGAGLAQTDGFQTDCTWLIFNASHSGTAIITTDPYSVPRGGGRPPIVPRDDDY